MDERARMRERVGATLGDRRLVWSGIRGEDVESLSDLPQLAASFSIIGRNDHRLGVESLAHEDITCVRPDLELYDIDDHIVEESAREFRAAHLRTLAAPSAIVPYRSSNFISAIWLARQDRCLHLGLFGAHELMFEHKPFVESSLRRLGIETIPWTYVADEDQLSLISKLARGPLVLRRSRTSGGEGFVVVRDVDELLTMWPSIPERFVSVAPLLEGALPLNVGATLWPNGTTTVHHPSVQLIGIPTCVTRRFGYCGNDFALAKHLAPTIIDHIETMTAQVGTWLHRHGYVGTYGVDLMVHNDRLLFVEVNPRFQGSTSASNRIDVALQDSCLLLEHVAAHLGIEPAAATRPLRSRVAESPPLSQIAVHNVGEAARLDVSVAVESASRQPAWRTAEVLASPEFVTERGALACRVVADESVTTTGYDLRPPWAGIVQLVARADRTSKVAS